MLFLTGAVELLDVSDKLPGLVHNQGLTKWRVCIFSTSCLENKYVIAMESAIREDFIIDDVDCKL